MCAARVPTAREPATPPPPRWRPAQSTGTPRGPLCKPVARRRICPGGECLPEVAPQAGATAGTHSSLNPCRVGGSRGLVGHPDREAQPQSEAWWLGGGGAQESPVLTGAPGTLLHGELGRLPPCTPLACPDLGPSLLPRPPWHRLTRFLFWALGTHPWLRF